MIVVYDSNTGIGKRFAESLGYPTQTIKEKLEEPCILITRNAGAGKIPWSTKRFIKKHPGLIKGFVNNNFTVLDPLGRTLYLAVADGRKFALIDNRAASVQRGLVNGRVWRELVPEPLKVQDVVALLAGRLERVPAFGVRAEQNPEHNGYWFSWDHPGLSHRVLVDKKTGLMARHLLLENEGGKTGILLDLRYIDYDQDRGSGYFWPRTTEVQGSLVKGSLRLARSGPLSFDPLPLSTFHPDIPPH